MAGIGPSPGLPPRFPCWCQATYSWGGETKKDLGFIEGDLIEALNAGDGSWWMGRLRRDPRAIGLFPSNFVKVLDPLFQPTPNQRNASPLQSAAARNVNAKSGTFRKPFQAYEKLGLKGSLENSREGTPDSDVEKKKKEKSKFRPYSSMKTAQAPTSSIKKQALNGASIQHDERPRIPDPLPRRGSRLNDNVRDSRSVTPTRPEHRSHHGPLGSGHSFHTHSRSPYSSITQSRRASPLPEQTHGTSMFSQTYSISRPASIDHPSHIARTPSPHPVHMPRDTSPQPEYYDHTDRYSPEQMDHDAGSSPPPPPPPAHRVLYQPSRAPSVDYDRHQSTTPIPPSPSGRMTPSPLRNAMNDVMNSLQDMAFQQDGMDAHSPSLDPRDRGEVWSPDAFEIVRSRSIAEHRAHSSLGFRTQHEYDEGHDDFVPADQQMLRMVPQEYGHRPVSRNSFMDMDNHVVDSARADDLPPQPPLKGSQFSRPTTASSQGTHHSYDEPLLPTLPQHSNLRARKSAYELGTSRQPLDRMYSTKTNVTNSTATSSATQSSASTQLTSHSIMSGHSAGGFSATSAGSLARRKFGMGSLRGHARSSTVGDTRSMIDLTDGQLDTRNDMDSGLSYHESHASQDAPGITPVADWTANPLESAGVLGGMMAPKAKKSGFFRKMIDSAKSTARTGAATARSTLGNASSSRPSSRSGPPSPTKSSFSANGVTSITGGQASRPTSASGLAARDMGLGGGPAGGEWMQVRRDVNRSNSLSRKEHEERIERCELLDKPALMPIELLHEIAEGNEGLDGLPVAESTDFNTLNLLLVDKSARFVQSLPSSITAKVLAQSHVCRPHRSDVQRLRAIFTWVAERITWEEDYEGQVDSHRAVQTKRGCSEEIAVLVHDMCSAVGLHAEVVRGYLKAPGEFLDLDTVARPNHWWNAVIVDGEWRIMDCALAGPTHPRRSAYSNASSQVADPWYFLTRPLEICYTHIPLLPEQQHIVPPISHEILVNLPCAAPGFFRNGLELGSFDTSMLHLDQLEMTHVHVSVPEDVECIAETEARAFAHDVDGDLFESGDVVTKRAFAQAEWIGGRKRFTIKAVLPGDEGQGVLKIYAGKRGLMHSLRDNPHPLAFALPLSHTGQNPPYEFHIRHPTPHAQRHDLYVVQPQCSRLVLNNTFVFCVRQHPSSLSRFSPDTWGAGAPKVGLRSTSPNPYARPSSAMSMASATTSIAGSSNYSDPSQTANGLSSAQQKPAKLAIQTPSQKIIRLTRKHEVGSGAAAAGAAGADGGLVTSWETVVKIGERGTWRGLVLADRSARWCVFAEWECV